MAALVAGGYQYVAAQTGTAAVYPTLVGLSARDALHTLGQLGVSARMVGAGLVVEQDPPAGAPVDSAATVTLQLQRRPIVRASETSE